MKTGIKLALICSMVCILTSNADIKVTLPDNCDAKTIKYFYAPINKYATAKTRAETGMVEDSVAINNCRALIKTPSTTDNLFYGISIDGTNGISLYLAPGDNVNVDISSIYPFSYSLSGTPLADGMNELLILETPFYSKIAQINDISAEEKNKLAEEYYTTMKDFIVTNPQGAAAPIALMNLGGENFVNLCDSLNQSFKQSMLYPLVERKYNSEQKEIAARKKQEAFASGTVEAPAFTLKGLDGEDISLADFRGKWVILDFWGSWCPWCIKGFPELKEAYKKYEGKLEIIGIDCNESEEDWRAGVEKYELPWVQVYNPADGTCATDYGVRGYPSKAIIDPEGKIRNFTVGHNPAFFEALSELMGE